MARSFRRPDILEKRHDKPEVLLIPSRIDDRAETDDRLAFQGEFEGLELEFPTRVFRFAENHPRPTASPPVPASPPPQHSFWRLQVPYFAKFSYRESLTFPDQGGQARVLPIPEMQQVYARLGAYLGAHAPVGSSLRQKPAPHCNVSCRIWCRASH